MTENKDSSCPLRTDWNQLGVHTYIKITIIGVLFYFLFRIPISGIVNKWVSDSNWSHGFLIPLFSLYFLNQRKEDILNIDPRPSYLGMILLILGIIFYPLNVLVFNYGVLEPLGVVATLGAMVLFLGGWKLIRYTWLPIGFLIFAVPLPDRIYFKLTYPMRELAAVTSGFILNLLNGIDTTIDGVIIRVFRDGELLSALNVEDACSGMRLLMAFLALGVAMAYLHYRPIWQRLILLSTTIPIAILCNIIRVTTTGLIHTFGNSKYAEGVWHSMLGMLMLLLAFGLYGGIAWFLENLFVEESKADVTADVIVRKQTTEEDGGQS